MYLNKSHKRIRHHCNVRIPTTNISVNIPLYVRLKAGNEIETEVSYLRNRKLPCKNCKLLQFRITDTIRSPDGEAHGTRALSTLLDIVACVSVLMAYHQT